MTAETILRAAALMRSRAQAATPGPWWGAVGKGPVRRKQQVALVGRADMRGQGEKSCIAVLAGINGHRADDAEHIASWHPAVALAVADWLDDIATRHTRDPDPLELTLHLDEECPTGECVDPGYHEGCVVCTGCYPSWDGMDGRCLYPCVELRAALAVATAYLGADQ